MAVTQARPGHNALTVQQSVIIGDVAVVLMLVGFALLPIGWAHLERQFRQQKPELHFPSRGIQSKADSRGSTVRRQRETIAGKWLGFEEIRLLYI
jgi:hypothetical protein